ncbi:MAG: choice-of-anchor J domain-containing protein [Bacteroidales bacterium]
MKADVNESFDGLSQSSYGNYDYNGFHIENGLCNSTNALSGNAVRLRNAVSYLEYNGTDGNGKDGGVGSISFWYRSWDNSPAAVLDVKVNVDGAGWVNIGAQINTTSTTYAEWSYLLNNASDNILIRIEYVSGERLHIDDFSITDYAGGGNAPPIITNIFQTPASTILSSTTVSVSADVTDSDGTISSVELHWGTAQGVLGTTISMTNTGLDTYTTDTDIPAQANGTTVYYEVYAEDDDSDGTTSAELSYDVIDPSTTTLPYSQTFDSDLGDCYNYNVSGPTNNWIWDDMGGPNGHAYMNGYGGSNPEEDWLIIPGIDFDSYANEIMQFYTFYEYGNEDANNYLKLFYSSDYAGVGDPSGATWTELSFIKASAWAQWQPSFIVDLSGIVGTNVYIGFKYYSTDAPRSWRIDDISIFEGSQVNVTFQVNMSEQTVSVDGVHLAGSFDTWWDPAGIELFDPEMDNIYTTTLLLYSGIEYQFKYVNGNAWGLDEGVPVECSAPGTTNRFEVIGGSDYAIDPVCFGSCVNCGTLAEYDVTFRVDMKNETVLGGVNIAGSFNGWSNTQ